MGARGRKSAADIATPPLQLVESALPVQLPDPPPHLSAAMQAWWRAAVRDYEFDPHHLLVLELAADAWDRTVQARDTVIREGLTVGTRDGGRKRHPAADIERDSRLAFARLVRELDLDCPPPRPGPYMPPPAIRSIRRR
jgi:phage terminase small subunit